MTEVKEPKGLQDEECEILAERNQIISTWGSKENEQQSTFEDFVRLD